MGSFVVSEMSTIFFSAEEKRAPVSGPSFTTFWNAYCAQYAFQKVVKEGPETGALFSSALKKMVDISDTTKDPIYLIRTIDKIDPDDYPGKVKDDLYYYQGPGSSKGRP